MVLLLMIIVDVFLKADITDSYLEAVDRLQRIRYIVVVIFANFCFFSFFLASHMKLQLSLG